MRSSGLSALWARALLAMLVAPDLVVDLVHAVTIESRSQYRSCINNPSGCTVMCAANHLSLSLCLLGATERKSEAM